MQIGIQNTLEMKNFHDNTRGAHGISTRWSVLYTLFCCLLFLAVLHFVCLLCFFLFVRIFDGRSFHLRKQFMKKKNRTPTIDDDNNDCWPTRFAKNRKRTKSTQESMLRIQAFNETNGIAFFCISFSSDLFIFFLLFVTFLVVSSFHALLIRSLFLFSAHIMRLLRCQQKERPNLLTIFI